MNRGEAKVGQRVRVPAWVFGNFADSRFLEATVTKESGGGWSEVVVEIEHEGALRHVNVCWLEPAPEINQSQENQP